jgi:hypothetical protein
MFMVHICFYIMLYLHSRFHLLGFEYGRSKAAPWQGPLTTLLLCLVKFWEGLLY